MRKLIREITAYLLAFFLLFGTLPVSYADSSAGKDITDLVYTYKRDPNAYDKVGSYLEDISSKDERLGKIWSDIMGFWIYANTDQTVNTEKLPARFSDDDSLCFVVLGYRLNPDGSMNGELKERCDVALKCSKDYKNAYIALAGGGTAFEHPDKTEADVMAEYMKENGVDGKRLIVENRSLTTGENVIYLGEKIIKDYPSVTSLIIVTSDYHVPESSLLFREYMYLSRVVDGSRDVQVVSNLANVVEDGFIPKAVTEQASYLWSIAETFKVTG